jgi:diguanylate cyclase (GGDEF)-like protein
MDLDHFKAINDNAGHAAGDRALRQVAELFRAQVRERDTLARLGGSECGLLLEHCPLTLARERARALQAAINDHVFKVDGRSFALGVSIGIASISHGCHDVRALMVVADAAFYKTKRGSGSASRIEEAISNETGDKPAVRCLANIRSVKADRGGAAQRQNAVGNR